MEIPAPHRPRRWSRACSGMVVRVLVGVMLVALVAWPERHERLILHATGVFDPSSILASIEVKRVGAPVCPSFVDLGQRTYSVFCVDQFASGHFEHFVRNSEPRLVLDIIRDVIDR